MLTARFIFSIMCTLKPTALLLFIVVKYSIYLQFKTYKYCLFLKSTLRSIAAMLPRNGSRLTKFHSTGYFSLHTPILSFSLKNSSFDSR